MPIKMSSQDPLFVLYTSGSTGKPKGIVHGTGGYLVYVAYTFKTVFDYKNSDIFWCTADFGWVTGHSYGLYGALLNGATTVMYEGVPNYPSWDAYKKIIEACKVTVLYTAPTVLRSLMQAQISWAPKSLQSLRLLGSVGEPIDTKTWDWYFKNVGQLNCPIVDTWWQTETGGILISSVPIVSSPNKPFMNLPLPGITPIVQQNNLVIKNSWPGITIGLLNDTRNFKDQYISKKDNTYITGDVAVHTNPYYRITGRADDVLNVSGHRLSTAEIEEAINTTNGVIESAAIGFTHPIKGTAITAFVVLKSNSTIKTIEATVKNQVALHIGPFAKPDYVYVVAELPKTRSGKIVRRLLRMVVNGAHKEFGDVSTLVDTQVLNKIVKDYKLKNSGKLL